MKHKYLGKVIVVLVSILLLVTALSASAISQKSLLQNSNKIRTKEISLIENRSLNVSVQRYENNILIPVKMCPVYIYIYPMQVPMWAFTNDQGYLTYEPLVYMGDDVKINAYHEWYGANTTYHNVKQSDPNPIYISLILDPNKSVSRNIQTEPALLQFLPIFYKILQVLLLVR
jgi:hypothetical protein